MHTQRIRTLRQCQAVDPQRGPFHVKAKPCKDQKHHRGARVYEDAFGVRFALDGSTTPQVRVAS